MSSLKTFRKSKIVCTLGPSTNSKEMLKKLITAGMDVARLNFSHSSHSHHAELYSLIRTVSNDVAILCDIQGPKIRIGEVNPPVTLIPGEKIKISVKENIKGTKDLISISHKGFLDDIDKGNFLYINDGLVKLEVVEIEKSKDYATCNVILGGLISDRKGVNIPSKRLSTTNPTKKDIEDLRFIAKLQPEYVAASFVGKADEVLEVRKILDDEGAPDTNIISKIERPIALENFDEILEVSDGIMVARGDLGVEIPLHELPLIQKEIILKTNIRSKPVIVATQMLESMITQPVPTRAEVSDVFNAIFDRSDAVMLSAETSIGKYPVETVQIMSNIVENAEKNIPLIDPNRLDSPQQETYETVGHGVYTMSEEFEQLNFSGKIICFTRRGKSARMISKYRPTLPIIALTDDMKTARQLNLVWGVKPVFMDTLKLSWGGSTEEIIQKGIVFLAENRYIGATEHTIVTIPSIISPIRSALIGIFYIKDILELNS